MVSYVAFSGELVCTQAGSPTPQNLASFASFLAARLDIHLHARDGRVSPTPSLRNPTRRTLNADTGTRIVVQYSGFPAGAQLVRSHRSSGFGRNAAHRGRRPWRGRFRRQVHARRHFVVAAFLRPEHRCQWCGRNSGLFARPSRLGYRDFGFHERSDAHQWLRHCRL